MSALCVNFVKCILLSNTKRQYQKIGRLRGPSAVCIGSERLGLPAIASHAAAVGSDNSGLTLNLESNAEGAKVSERTKEWKEGSKETGNMLQCN